MKIILDSDSWSSTDIKGDISPVSCKQTRNAEAGLSGH